MHLQWDEVHNNIYILNSNSIGLNNEEEKKTHTHMHIFHMCARFVRWQVNVMCIDVASATTEENTILIWLTECGYDGNNANEWMNWLTGFIGVHEYADDGDSVRSLPCDIEWLFVYLGPLHTPFPGTICSKLNQQTIIIIGRYIPMNDANNYGQ